MLEARQKVEIKMITPQIKEFFYKQCCLFAAFLHQSKKSFFDNKQSKNITVKQKNDRPIFLDILHTNFMALSLCTLEKFSV